MYAFLLGVILLKSISNSLVFIYICFYLSVYWKNLEILREYKLCHPRPNFVFISLEYAKWTLLLSLEDSGLVRVHLENDWHVFARPIPQSEVTGDL